VIFILSPLGDDLSLSFSHCFFVRRDVIWKGKSAPLIELMGVYSFSLRNGSFEKMGMTIENDEDNFFGSVLSVAQSPKNATVEIEDSQFRDTVLEVDSCRDDKRGVGGDDDDCTTEDINGGIIWIESAALVSISRCLFKGNGIEGPRITWSSLSFKVRKSLSFFYFVYEGRCYLRRKC